MASATDKLLLFNYSLPTYPTISIGFNRVMNDWFGKCHVCMHFRIIPRICNQLWTIFTFYLTSSNLIIFSKQLNVFCLCYWHASFLPLILYDKTKWIPINKILYSTYIRQIFCNNTCIYGSLDSEKTRVLIITSLTLKVTLRRYSVRGIFRANLS